MWALIFLSSLFTKLRTVVLLFTMFTLYLFSTLFSFMIFPTTFPTGVGGFVLGMWWIRCVVRVGGSLWCSERCKGYSRLWCWGFHGGYSRRCWDVGPDLCSYCRASWGHILYHTGCCIWNRCCWCSNSSRRCRAVDNMSLGGLCIQQLHALRMGHLRGGGGYHL